jgi:hypothetical protein
MCEVNRINWCKVDVVVNHWVKFCKVLFKFM